MTDNPILIGLLFLGVCCFIATLMPKGDLPYNW